MIIHTLYITLEQISVTLNILTPLILLFWFYYTQKQLLSRNYYLEIDGVYAGFTEPVSDIPEKKSIKSGIIMNIRYVDNNGFFKGELCFGENLLTIQNNVPNKKLLRIGIITFLGKLNYKLYLNRSRHPFKPKQNRTYLGRLYIATRLDFQFESYNIKDYLDAEYYIIHYREMQTLKFTLKKRYKKKGFGLPKSFKLYKNFGVSFEPYKGVKDVVFDGKSLVDK